ncbi:MAG: hypothetical protein N4A57_18080 [Anaeromicrobium sp.]|jgi:Tfp pilus assembly protein FimT|uniref:hypothetical protein n=1 Tax=Anaeromicrobium sp. TaxID=1929132 RepID=UPI0025E37CBC|nr:hypothetical protein [Anaeromicrobium sp.]MCT4596159.1 hypothetical protein [Anaeromicrobium sp.]
MKSKGMSLIEIIILMALMTIVFTLSLKFNTNKIDDFLLQSTGKIIKSYMELAKEISIKERTPYRVIFDSNENTITIRERNFNPQIIDHIQIDNRIRFIGKEISILDFNSNGHSRYFNVVIENKNHKQMRIKILPVTNEVKVEDIK